MVETSESSFSTTDFLKDTGHKVAVAGESLTLKGAGSLGTNVAKHAGAFGDAMLLGGAVSVGLTQWDYVQARDNLRKQYEKELVAQSGKEYNELTNKDLDNLGKKNAVIGDALKRLTKKRNLELVVGVLAVGAGLALGAVVLGALTGGAVPMGIVGIYHAMQAGSFAAAATGLAQGLVASAGSVAGYMGAEKIANNILEPRFNMKEPSFKKVMKHPELQQQLSVSRQVDFIEHLQKRIKPNKPETFISQEQVFTALLAGNPQMAENIKANYGANFGNLPPEQRTAILTNAGQSIDLAQLTSDLNHGQVRAQELAFIMQGESSGVPRRDGPVPTRMEKVHAGIQQELAEAKAAIHHLKQKFKVTDTKLGAVQGATIDMTPPPSEPPVLNNQEVRGPATQRLLAQRQAAAGQTARA